MLGGSVVRRLRSAASLSASLLITGCSIHPLPDDVTRDNTLEIINKIRCEVRDALVDEVYELLEKPDRETGFIPAGHEKILHIMDTQGTSEDVLCNLPPIHGALNESAYSFLTKFSDTSLAYKFEFDIFENKIKKGGLTLSMPFFKNSTYTIQSGVSSDKKRKNKRNVDLEETFQELLLGKDASGNYTGLRCDEVRKSKGIPRKHIVYPITGNIGARELIDTYVKVVNTSLNFASFSDQLRYTTVFQSGPAPGVKPSATIAAPELGKMKLTAVDAQYTAERNDVHLVKITLHQEPKEIPKPEIVQADPRDHLTSVLDIVESGKNKKLGEKKGLSLSLITVPPAKKTSSTLGVCPVMRPASVNIVRRDRSGRMVTTSMPNPLSQTAEQESNALTAVRKAQDDITRQDEKRELRDLIDERLREGL